MSSSATAPIALHDLNILATRIGEFDDAPPGLAPGPARSSTERAIVPIWR